jgi:hypothetical protein
MKLRYLIGLLAACVTCAVVEARGQSDTIANLTPQLQLTTEIVDARFCEKDYLRLELRLKYLNIGDQRLIIYRQSNVIMTYFISKKISDAVIEKYEQKFSPLQSPVGPPEDLDTENPDKQTFVVLNPSASYEVTSQAHLPFIFDGKMEESSSLRPGRHILEIRVQTWPAPSEVAAKLRERWRAHGYLWTQSVISRPMTFDVAKHPTVLDCSTKLH